MYGRDVCQDVCPWNVKFARELEEPAFAPRGALGTKDARTLARELLSMDQPAFRAAFKGSPVKRAKLRGLKRNAAVVLGNVGAAADVGRAHARARRHGAARARARGVGARAARGLRGAADRPAGAVSAPAGTRDRASAAGARWRRTPR